MFRHRASWAAIALFCAACLWFAATYFHAASPIVTVDLQMDREAALASAADLTARHGWGPQGFRQAAAFRQLDRQVQMYVELEGGGREAFQQMLDEGHYRAYVWVVRHFRPEEATETEIRFTPAGRPDGFAVRLPEDEPGASLAAGEARVIAERAAREDWGVALEAYALIESSQETRPSGRTDHWFVYERSDLHVGDARYRVRLGVAGDRFSQLTHFVHVPEGFTRRFEEMRSRNLLISLASTITFVLLFIVGGCGVGLFHLLRHRWVLWRAPLFAGGGVALLMLLAGVNELPLAWMGYDTAVSPQAFLARHLATLAALSLGLTAFVTLVVMAAESLTRRAFPSELQLWRLWSPQAARSDSVLGRTLGGYAFAAFGLASVVAFYLVMMRLPGWWSPSDTLLRPDLLATPLPSLSAIAMALMAGVWEESVFRAIPIAGAALIGARFGRPRLWIGSAVVFQALVFAAAHADYPQQPAYARVLEIFPDALLWGIAYLYFGLLPVILAHFTYNLAWMSLPLFIAEGPGLWLDRGLVIAAALVPLAMVLRARIRQGALAEPPASVRNGAWAPVAPTPGAQDALAPPEADLAPAPVDARVRPALLVAAALGLALFAALTPWRSAWPSMDADRRQALALARGELDARGLAIGDQWHALPSIQGRPGEASEFVWRTGGPGAYGQLLGDYLPGPHWIVRFATFEGPVEERAEEVIVTVAADGGITRVQHRLPEARPGATIDEEEGRRLAQAAIASELTLDPASLREVSAVADRRPHRQDWTFTYADPGGYPLDDGEARIRAVVAGDRVADVFRFVHVPEEWSRARRAEQNRTTVVGIGAAVLLGPAPGGRRGRRRCPLEPRRVPGADRTCRLRRVVRHPGRDGAERLARRHRAVLDGAAVRRSGLRRPGLHDDRGAPDGRRHGAHRRPRAGLAAPAPPFLAAARVRRRLRRRRGRGSRGSRPVPGARTRSLRPALRGGRQLRTLRHAGHQPRGDSAAADGRPAAAAPPSGPSDERRHAPPAARRGAGARGRPHGGGGGVAVARGVAGERPRGRGGRLRPAPARASPPRGARPRVRGNAGDSGTGADAGTAPACGRGRRAVPGHRADGDRRAGLEPGAGAAGGRSGGRGAEA
jgi:hypothetical protein